MMNTIIRSAIVSEFASLQRLALAGESGESSAPECCREIAARLPELLGRSISPLATHSSALEGRHAGGARGFVHMGSARYTACDPKRVDSVSIGIYHAEGGTSGEFTMSWAPLSGELTASLEVFDDAFAVLPLFYDVFAKLAEVSEPQGGAWDWRYPQISAEQLCAILKACGVEDQTPRFAPVRAVADADPPDMAAFVRSVLPSLSGAQQREAHALLARSGDKT